MTPVAAVVFDLDGTLMDSRIDYEKMSRLIRELLVSRGVKEPLEDRRKVYRVIRGGAATLREYGMPESMLEETLQHMEKIMNGVELEALSGLELRPYAREAVAALYESGLKLGVATRSHREYTVRSLDAFNLIGYFQQIVARDDVPYPKPDPRHLLHTLALLEVEPEKTMFVGDTTTDLETATAAGVDFIGYWRDDAWAQRLIDSGCQTIVRDLREIPRIVAGRR